MSQHAMTVVRLLEELQRMDFPEDDGTRVDSNPMQQSPDDPRPPKRPWEDISQEEGASMSDPNSFVDVCVLNFLNFFHTHIAYSSTHRQKTTNLKLRLSKIWSSSAQNVPLAQQAPIPLQGSRKASIEKEV